MAKQHKQSGLILCCRGEAEHRTLSPSPPDGESLVNTPR